VIAGITLDLLGIRVDREDLVTRLPQSSIDEVGGLG
jgi:hypothetical protein